MPHPFFFIDEMESIEHTKLKPLTLPLAVGDDYRIYAVSVGRIQAKGPLADLSRKKIRPPPIRKVPSYREIV